MMELKTFAVAVYSATGVSEACLTLQDQNHVDVPLLLFCGWYGAYVGPLPAAQLTLARGISQQLGQHLIKPLRQARRWMKTHSVDLDSEQRWSRLREDIKRAELDAELLMLDTLAAMVTGPDAAAGTTVKPACADHKSASDTILHNLELLVASDDTRQTDSNKTLLALICAACFDAAQTP